MDTALYNEYHRLDGLNGYLFIILPCLCVDPLSVCAFVLNPSSCKDISYIELGSGHITSCCVN